MISLEELQKFENELLSVGDEKLYRESRNQKVASFSEEQAEQVGEEKEIDFENLDSALDELANKESEQDRQDRLSDEHSEKKEKEHQMLSSMFDEVLEEEGISVDQLEQQGSTEASENEIESQAQDEDTSFGEDSTNIEEPPSDEALSDEKEQLEDQADSVIETPEDEDISMGDESVVQDDTTEEVIDATSQDESPPQDDDAVVSTPPVVDINTENLDEEEQEILKEGDFVLPEAYLVNKTFEEAQEGTTTAEIEDDLQIQEFLSDASSIFESDVEAQDSDARFSGQIDPNALGFMTDEDLDKAPEKYRTDRDFTPEDEQLLMEKLSGYNIYLSKAIVNILENEELADDAERLIDLIFSDARPQIVHHEIERIYGEVELFQDNNIYDSEELKKHFITLAHILQESANILITRVIPAAAAAFIFLFYAYNFLYRPLSAIYYYEKGYNEVEAANYEEGEKKFLKATSFWLMDSYFFKYADMYKQKRLFDEEKKKYYQIIFGVNPEINKVLQDLFVNDRLFVAFTINGTSYIPANLIRYDEKAFLAAIDYEVHQAANYDKSLKLFNLWIDKYDTNENILISYADLYLVMYDETKNQFFLDQARTLYDKLTFITDDSDKSLILRSRWAIRANDTQYLNDIVEGIFASRDSFKISDELVTPMVEIVKYELRRGKTKHIADTIDSLKNEHPDLLVIPYLYALYYDLIPDYAEKKNMLLSSIAKFEKMPELSNEERYDYIDARIRLSELYLYDENNILAAKENITKAQIILEKNKVKYKDSELYRLYFIESQIELLKGNLALSQEFLEKSIEFGYETQESMYHLGLLNFLNKNWAEASKIFTEIIDKDRTGINQHKGDLSIIYLAIANSMLMQKNYTVAVMYYSKLLDILDSFSGDQTIFTIDTNKNINVVSIQSRKAQIENNLGVALYYLSKQRPNGNINTSLLKLQKSNQMFQHLTRDNQEYVRKNYVSTAQINSDTILLGGDNLAIYSDISYYLHNESYWLVQQKIKNTLPVN